MNLLQAQWMRFVSIFIIASAIRGLFLFASCMLREVVGKEGLFHLFKKLVNTRSVFLEDFRLQFRLKTGASSCESVKYCEAKRTLLSLFR
jgi:hypothetical protein